MTALDTRQAELLREAAAWRVLSLLLECPSQAWRGQLTALAREIDDAELRAACDAAMEEADEGLYHSIFGPGGPAPPREVSYRDTVQLGYLLSEIAAYYDAFAYQPRTPEVPDHVSVEAGFIGYLRIKEAYALACSDDEHASVAAGAAREFLTEHFSPLAHSLAVSLQQCGVRYLELTAQALARRAGTPASPLLPVTQDESEFDCG
jgi:nitrate reductase assembly molybdenum cofactor insertion protein NarJ